MVEVCSRIVVDWQISRSPRIELQTDTPSLAAPK
jgi:hypothetical protein